VWAEVVVLEEIILMELILTAVQAQVLPLAVGSKTT
jgi:hypothetical protein